MPAIHLLLIIFIKIGYLHTECILAFRIPIEIRNLHTFNIYVGHIPFPERSGEGINWKHPKDTKRLHRYHLKAKGINCIPPNLTKLHLRRNPNQIELLESILSLL
ncbi:hypothetical protein BmR1_04g09405 [Babesia microti strain RI]|uniref:Uncharacterized protein n=1 Tax=Babesia microti (strain RI) TaxID=1133968 RepID=A0A1N6LYE9_BABMR|nr:hypothetical protein BmR1_04g09405 [Babesia microti strain RI]SIO73892.1 hypothetical protein BmR1_04g09405 [Babesia microti strain RI]|eukprot:XP_021337943.1 hypothetical protein BmR1_04g09405 [Babesia microti strain RI]